MSTLKRYVCVIGIGLVLSLLFSWRVMVTPAYAAVFVVNNPGDAGDSNPGDGICATATKVCTLRAAIEEANAHPGVDTITIPAMTIVLSKELDTKYIYGNDTSVIIQGAGQNNTIIDGNKLTRVFYFEARSGSHTISDLTIRNGYNLNTTDPNRWVKDGGGIFSEASLTLNNVTITNCQAYQGGGIYGEHAFLGPAGWNIPSLTLHNVTLTGNRATSQDYGYAGGGGLFSGSLLTADGLVITGNSAIQGGGLYQNSPKSVDTASTVTNFTISNNGAVDGAGIDNDLGALTLTNGKIENNVGSGFRPGCSPSSCIYTGGGGIYNNLGTLIMQNVSVNANKVTTAGSYGGGIYNFQYMSLTNVTISHNTAATGAGISNGNYQSLPNSLTLINVTVGENTGQDSTTPYVDSQGGGIYNNGYMKILTSTIAKNKARYGGGFQNLGTVDMYNSIIADNTAAVASPDCRSTLSSDGHNLIGTTAGCSYNAGPFDLVNVQPMIGSLTGSPSYYPLSVGSPAIDGATDSNCPSFDERGSPRPQGASCDMGAYEYKMSPSTPPSHFVFLPITLH